ncbi:hypothetical protein F0562_001046 [Nyssa sinensis]|uniref:Alpha-1,4 glucan phosphorylase n=1 Tax=Nyssa sinensis TaxID=561372 RepID=A0A5J5C5Y9_9ASTE|nr:hypothetical protein F0562_001046 [Nyssa sinensis]
MNFPLTLERSVRRCSVSGFQNPKPFTNQPSNIKLSSRSTESPNQSCFPRFFPRTCLRIGFPNDALEICTLRLTRVGASSNGARSFPSGSFRDEDEVREPSFVEFITSERVKVVAMLALALALCNADRVVMSVAIVPLSLANGWRQSFGGVVQSSFLWGYLISPIAGGTLVDYYGGKVVMAWGVALWSLATFLTPWAAETSLWALLAMRVLLGIAEGVALPCMNNMIRRWFPQTERSRAVGLAMAGFQLGSAIGLSLSPILMSQGGVFGPFVIFGLSGFLWVLVWVSATSSTPDLSPQISKSELEYIQNKRQKFLMVENKLKTTKVIPPFRRLLSKLPTWSLIVANAMHSWGFFVILSWMPIYFKTMYNVDLRQAAWFSAVPWSMMALVGYFAGLCSDVLIQRGMSVTLTRKIMQSIGFVGPGIALIGLTMAKIPSIASAWLTLAVSLKSFSHFGFLVNLQEIAPQYSGVLHGMSNTAGTLAAILGTVGAGFFVELIIYRNVLYPSCIKGNVSPVLLVFGPKQMILLQSLLISTENPNPRRLHTNVCTPRAKVLEMANTAKAKGTATSGISAEVTATAHPIAEEPTEIASNIRYHAHYSRHFSPLKFKSEQTYYATAESVRDYLIHQWNETNLHFYIIDPKKTYYFSMEYLQGRALTNAIGNLNLQDAYADALRKLGRVLEEIAEQEKDAALGNGGLGRLASCFLDSMATLNLPAWGYGLRYRYGLFKQRITKAGQEEIAEDWLEKFSPWEVVRHDVVFPVRFFGHVELHHTGSRKWVGGEVIQALAYDVPIPGYKTINTINLRLWEAKAGAEDFNLSKFNDGQYESAAQLHSKAQQICAVLYPGDSTAEGKLLRLKQQFFLCSASLQDIIFRFKEREFVKGSRTWSEFPSKVAVQLNDTHPALAIPELMRLLMDDEGLGWDGAWDVTTRTIAYTNHSVLPEALQKLSQVVMRKLLPRHLEIIAEIDKQFIAMIHSTRPDLVSKLRSMRILDNDPHKPLVRMANLCVVSGHTVNGVSQLHSEILKSKLFADYVSIWPTKFQNITNGITPRRWLRFCNPELSHVITKWLKTDEWVTGLDLLADLQAISRYKKLKEMSP